MLNRKTFQQRIEDLCAHHKTQNFLLTVSGGVDSMVLFDLFKETELQFQVAHINYKLRGNDSENDQILVQKICAQYEVPFHLYKVAEIDKKPENSIQEWARTIRYNFFRKIQEEENLEFIVTAHHLNDQLETFLINLSKASGIKGLSGIPANENKILRPLLSFSKEEIYKYAEEKKIDFREDLSNQQNNYLRNKIRNTIVPDLLDTNDHFLENFKKSISYLDQTKTFVEDQIFKIVKEIIINKEDHILINKEAFLKVSSFVQFEILRKYDYEAKEILKIKKAKPGKKFISKNFELTVDRENFIIKNVVDEISDSIDEEFNLVINRENQIIIPAHLQAEITGSGSFNWELDLNKINLPLKIRRKKEGDLFHPIGMIGKKKISKFFKDEKIPILAQQKIWLLCDEKNDVLGVIPFRQDRRFAASKESKNSINIKL